MLLNRRSTSIKSSAVSLSAWRRAGKKMLQRPVTIMLATPPEMRGRVSSVNWLFLGASNEFGEYESGLTAHWWGAVRAVVIGGAASMMVTGLWSVFFPALRHADKLTTDDLIEVERQFSSIEPVG